MKNAIHTFHIDHILPLEKGGTSALSNLALSCGGCNSMKAAKTTAIDPLSGSEVNLFHPRKDQWYAHFSWADDYLEIIGLTATGRATIEFLRLNRIGLINMRQLTKLIGEHPPEE